MNSRELFIANITAEGPAFGRVLQALPADKLDYAPHPKSRTAHSLAAQIAFTPNLMVELLQTGKLSFNPNAPIPTYEQILEAGKHGHEALVKQLASVSDADWNDKKCQMVMPDGSIPWEDTLGNMSWGLLHDAIHHRGQLSAYIRPMGGKVPMIYGPSGDDSGMPPQ